MLTNLAAFVILMSVYMLVAGKIRKRLEILTGWSDERLMKVMNVTWFVILFGGLAIRTKLANSS